MAFMSKVKNRVSSGDSREIIANILEFMRQEAEAGTQLIPLAKVHELVARATGVSNRTITRIAKEKRMISSEETCSFSTPSKKRKKQNSKIVLDIWEFFEE
jgi:hypothetical protein